jgi:enamine deaminase RidA (YjgF/YER057c/UK114 family)
MSPRVAPAISDTESQAIVSAQPQITVVNRFGRQCADSGAKWEPIVGYSRAVRSGQIIAVTGTVGINADGSYPDGVYQQARLALSIIRSAVEALGGRVEQIIRTRMFVIDITQWQHVAKAHAEVFAEIRPATTMVQVARLIDDNALIEIEADAIVMS